jgi:hypothetical protein
VSEPTASATVVTASFTLVTVLSTVAVASFNVVEAIAPEGLLPVACVTGGAGAADEACRIVDTACAGALATDASSVPGETPGVPASAAGAPSSPATQAGTHARVTYFSTPESFRPAASPDRPMRRVRT